MTQEEAIEKLNALIKEIQKAGFIIKPVVTSASMQIIPNPQKDDGKTATKS